MVRLILFALVGCIAQLIDGAVGMSYGLSSSSVLLVIGISPAIVSATVHIGALASTAASGFSHFRFGNINKYIIKTLILPGSIGAFFGACLLSYIPGQVIKPYIAGFLLVLGFYVLFRFVFDKRRIRRQPQKRSRRKAQPKRSFLYPLALVAGFLDSVGGGGWGPLNTPVLMSRTQMEPRKVIGSVDTSEFFVALAATIGFLVSLGFGEINWTWAAALAAGGFIAAPVAAWLVKILPSSILGVLAGGVIILTNTRTLLTSFDILPPPWQGTIYSSFLTLWIFSLIFVIWIRKVRQSKK